MKKEKYKEKYLEQKTIWTATCTAQVACEEDYIGRLPSSVGQSESETAEEAVKEFEADGWDFEFEYEGAEMIACPFCVDYLKGN